MKGMRSPTCLLHLFLFLPSIFLLGCSAGDTISIAEPLQDPNFIVSSGKIFKLGFFSPENTSSRYVGIMYNVPKMEAVWVANRDKPFHDSSGVVTVSEDGNLVILNGKKEIIWSSDVSNSGRNSTAQLLENGNLVLRDSSNGRSVWESFQIPTDTLMRTMKVGRFENATLQLTSWRSPSDPSPGNFTLGVNPLQIAEIFVWNRGAIYWRSGPWNGNVFVGIPGRSAVYRDRFDLVTDNSGTAYFSYNYTNVSSLFHYRLISSGSLQEVVFNETGDWTVRYSTLSTECGLYGKCGPNGRCDPNGSPICSCLPGFEPGNKSEWSEGKWSGGCQRKTLLQCDRNSSAGQQGEEDGYLKFANVKVPDLSNYVAAHEEECGNECSKNCSCSAYTFVVGLGCLHWADNLIDIQQFSMDGSDLYIRVPHSELDQVRRRKQKTKAIIASTLAVGVLVIAASIYILWRWRMKHRGEMGKSEFSSMERSELEDMLVYSYETLATATDNFHNKNKLGQGGFGPVYKGKLVNGQEIAVKRLSNSSSQGIKEFMNEVTVISKLQHRNLVRLLGCCVEKEEKMLVYEYMPNKSLDAYIFDSGRQQDLLDWNRRSIIIEGISRGLLYLHRDSRLRIIHRDMKASNILLDEDLNPKISDFGLARIFGGSQDQASTNRVVGTYGYMAPEYAMGGKFSEKSDVYSFGVLLLEIVSGRKNTSFHLAEENLSLLGYAWKLWNENEALRLAFIEPVDPSTEMEILRCIHIGLLCVQESADDRPNMANVVLMLNSDIVELPRPKTPAYTARLSLFQEPSSQKSEHSVNGVTLTEVQGR